MYVNRFWVFRVRCVQYSTMTVHSAEHTTSCKHALKEEWLMMNSRDILSLNLFEICNECNFRLERKGLYRKHYLSTLDAAQEKIYHRFCGR